MQDRNMEMFNPAYRQAGAKAAKPGRGVRREFNT